MAHFMVGCAGNNSEVTRLAGKNVVPTAFVRGWDSGVQAEGRHDDGVDKFEIYATGGSHARVSNVHLGTVLKGKNGKLRFVRSKRV